MMTPNRIASLGAIIQLGYVPGDFDAALDYWINTMGAGPFYLLENVGSDWTKYLGESSDPVFTIALGHLGDMQIEIIRQENAEASPHLEWRAANSEGLHHVAIAVDDITKAREVCVASGAKVIFSGQVGESEWLYVDTGGGPGSIVEIVKHSPESKQMMAMIRDAERGWDGKDPIRTLNLTA